MCEPNIKLKRCGYFCQSFANITRVNTKRDQSNILQNVHDGFILR
jgi:hypothetical protein